MPVPSCAMGGRAHQNQALNRAQNQHSPPLRGADLGGWYADAIWVFWGAGRAYWGPSVRKSTRVKR